MEKSLNVALFGLACVMGVFLFAVGIRQIKQKAHSRYATRFLFYLSVVLVSLGSIVGVNKLGQTPIYAQEKEAANKLTKHPDWLAFQQTYARTRGEVKKEDLKNLEEAVTAAQKKMDGLYQNELISRELSGYLKNLLSDRLAQIKQRLEDKKPISEEVLTTALKNIKFQNRVLSELVRDTAKNDPWLAQTLKDEGKDTFQAIKKVALTERLKTGNLKRDEYRELVGQLMDNLFVYCMKCLPVVAAPSEDEPEVVTKYGVDIMPPVQEKKPPASAAINNIKGDLLAKQVGKNWGKVAAGAQLFTTTVVDNQTDETVTLTFTNGMTVEISKQEVLTGWEIEAGFKVSAELQAQITGLIKQFSSDDWATREKASEELKKIGPVAKGILEETLKIATDPEVKMRINQVLKNIAEKLKTSGGEAIGDNLVRQPSPFDDRFPIVAPEYGVIPK